MCFNFFSYLNRLVLKEASSGEGLLSKIRAVFRKNKVKTAATEDPAAPAALTEEAGKSEKE